MFCAQNRKILDFKKSISITVALLKMYVGNGYKWESSPRTISLISRFKIVQRTMNHNTDEVLAAEADQRNVAREKPTIMLDVPNTAKSSN